MTEREKIIEIIKRNGTYNGRSLSFDYYVVQPDDLADALIAAGYGDMKRYKEKIKRLKATIVKQEEAAREVIYRRTKRAEQHLNMPADITDRLREIASKITDIADEIEEVWR